MKKTSILFVCLGNICRSPMAEGVMKKIIEEQGLEMDLTIDSAGILSIHQGEQPDRRMQQAAFARGYRLNHLSRPVVSNDFEKFDIIIGMDDSNIDVLEQKAPTYEAKQKIHRMADYFNSFNIDHVPDPYYGGAQGFKFVINLLEEGCNNLINKLKELQ
jgi:protein-tyrosine phosphatase